MDNYTRTCIISMLSTLEAMIGVILRMLPCKDPEYDRIAQQLGGVGLEIQYLIGWFRRAEPPQVPR